LIEYQVENMYKSIILKRDLERTVYKLAAIKLINSKYAENTEAIFSLLNLPNLMDGSCIMPVWLRKEINDNSYVKYGVQGLEGKTERKACGTNLLAVAAIAAHVAATLAMLVELRIIYRGGALCFNPKQLSKMKKKSYSDTIVGATFRRAACLPR
jgi:hypothetical protein